MALSEDQLVNQEEFNKLLELAARLNLIKDEKYLTTGNTAATKARKASVNYSNLNDATKFFDLKIFQGANGAIRFGKAYKPDDELVLTVNFQVERVNPLVRRVSSWIYVEGKRYEVLTPRNMTLAQFNTSLIQSDFKKSLVEAVLAAARSE